MQFIPATKVSSFSLIFEQDGQRIQNTFYAYHVQGWDAAKQEAVCASLVNWWTVGLRAITASNCKLVQIDYRDWTTYDGIGGTYTTGLPLTGMEVTAPLPNNVTLCVSWKTGKRGRSYRGRTFHVGLAEGQVNGNTAEGAYVADLQTAYADLKDMFSSVADRKMVQVSRYSNKAPRVSAAVSDITGFAIDSTVDSQRRRLPGRGK